MPCIDTYKKVDLRTVSFDVPPQEVGSLLSDMFNILFVWMESNRLLRHHDMLLINILDRGFLFNIICSEIHLVSIDNLSPSFAIP